MRRTYIYTLFLFLLLSFSLNAADIFWDGGGTTDNWSEAANWTGDVLPGASDHARFAWGAGDAIVDINVTILGITEFRNESSITVNSGITLTLIGSTGYGIYAFGGILINNGTIVISNSSSNGCFNRAPSTITNNGTMAFDGPGNHGIDNRALFTNNGTVTINNIPGRALDMNAGTFENNGMLEIAQTAHVTGFAIASIGGSFTNTGTMLIGSATYHVGGRGLQSSGTIINSGTMNFENVVSWSIQSTTFNNNSQGVINIGMNTTCGNHGIHSTGIFTNEMGATINIDKIPAWATAVNDAGGTFNNNGLIFHNVNSPAVKTIVSTGTFTNNSNGEIVSGKTIDGNNFTNEGTLSPGNSPGTMTISNVYTGNADAKFNIELGGTTASIEYDQVNFTGVTNNIGNTDLVVTTIDGHVPTLGNTYDVVLGNGYTGTFASETLPTPPTSTMWEVDYTSDPNKVTLKLVATLPVELVDLKAKYQNKMIYLNWSTISEINSSMFEIEHSSDNINWKTIGNRNANGSSNSLIQYEFIDKNPINNDNYYRLKLIDRDGSYDYSSIVMANVPSRHLNEVVTLYPNPAQDYIRLNIVNPSKISIYNSAGILVDAKYVNVNDRIDVSSLSSGIYYLQYTESTGKTSKLTFVKSK